MKESQYPTRAYLIVEGPDDKTFFGRYTDPNFCTITVAHGRPKVVEVILHLERSGFRGALGIVDADFEVLERIEPPSPNILATDHHDVECMMLASPALSHLLRNLGDEERIASFQAEKVVPHLLSVGRMVGYLRWASARNKWSLKFEGLSFKAFVREKDFSFEPRLLFEEIRRHQGGRGPLRWSRSWKRALRSSWTLRTMSGTFAAAMTWSNFCPSACGECWARTTRAMSEGSGWSSCSASRTKKATSCKRHWL
jgi:hypothetical protein